MGLMVGGHKSMQSAFGSTSGAFTTLVSLYDIANINERFLTSLSETVSSLATGHYDNQKRFVDAGILERLVSLASQRADQGVQLAAVNAFRDLVNGTAFLPTTILIMRFVRFVKLFGLIVFSFVS
jgi:hypothetical protein